MKELAFYGRGGQGAVTAAKILVATCLKDNLYAQAVPSFGQERKGAPVYAYSRISNEPVAAHTYVYEPDCVVVFDWSLLDLDINFHQGVKPGNILVANFTGSVPQGLSQYAKIGFVDAWAVTREVIGNVPPNAAMLGALARTTGWFNLASLKEALQEAMPGRKGELNAACAQTTYERTSIMRQCPVAKESLMLPVLKLFTKGHQSLMTSNKVIIKREGPYATKAANVKTGAWRQVRPQVDLDKCNGCTTCTKYCPTGILEVVDKKLVIDYTYCKGCGICPTVCPRQALIMVPEEGGSK